ncbi:hypothetical protein EO98_10825 [Methanosarcina sp. 2.H.T.1A.6]|nr:MULTISPECIES: hypothetical protein [unclassified Methanosarcina]KKG10158.1 hypothetical protein EO97_12095 [Methanosarcina sp. 2.H.T.1A.15]KKG16525.1 hypothetical protein EO94_10590 [Methanosarcina sp. 2.H.T.1A.3]KKG23264.1 hypothetical protein EO98_10825 [Methanosarcina sp. 2.H.T.1A.6]KKG25041.1 hypothetical protein EO96_11740 [Methanosarcina sp. 2.H.T.1A.8]
MTILTAMNSSKSEDSVLPSHLSDRAVSENQERSPAVHSTLTYESSTFSSPALDQLSGLLPDFNNRLSPTRDLGLSPLGQPRLSSEAHPRLVSDSDLGLVSGAISSPLSGLKTEYPETPVGKELEVMPDLPGRTLAGNKVGSLTLGADLPIGLVESKLITLSSTEEKLKNAEKDRK